MSWLGSPASDWDANVYDLNVAPDVGHVAPSAAVTAAGYAMRFPGRPPAVHAAIQRVLASAGTDVDAGRTVVHFVDLQMQQQQ